MICTASPGMKRMSVNTMIDTIIRVGMSKMTRRAR